MEEESSLVISKFQQIQKFLLFFWLSLFFTLARSWFPHIVHTSTWWWNWSRWWWMVVASGGYHVVGNRTRLFTTNKGGRFLSVPEHEPLNHIPANKILLLNGMEASSLNISQCDWTTKKLLVSFFSGLNFPPQNLKSKWWSCGVRLPDILYDSYREGASKNPGAMASGRDGAPQQRGPARLRRGCLRQWLGPHPETKGRQGSWGSNRMREMDFFLPRDIYLNKIYTYALKTWCI